MLIHRILLIPEDHHMVVSLSGIRVCQWKPTMLVQPRLVYPTQPMQTMLAIPTIPIVITVPQSHVQIVVS